MGDAMTTKKVPRRERVPPLSLEDRIRMDLPVDVLEAAAILQLAPGTIYELVSEGRLKRCSPLGRVRFLPSYLRTFVNQRVG